MDAAHGGVPFRAGPGRLAPPPGPAVLLDGWRYEIDQTQAETANQAQGWQLDCGPACVSAWMCWEGEPAARPYQPPDWWRDNWWGYAYRGPTYAADLAACLSAQGVACRLIVGPAGPSVDVVGEVLAALERGRPAIVLLHWLPTLGHFVVLTGYDPTAQVLTYHQVWGGYRSQMSVDDLRVRHDGYAVVGL